MGDYNLMICKTCKIAEWTDDSELADFIEEHMSHTFTILTDGTLDDSDHFRSWFLKFMGWPREAEG